MLVCLGPFAMIRVGLKRSSFSTFEGAFVPKTTVELDNERIYKIFYVKTDIPTIISSFDFAGESAGISFGKIERLYYVVYETSNVDFYRAYLAKLPNECEELKALKLPRCPECGSWDVEIDADEMICRRCRAWEFWNYEEVWKPKELSSEEILQGEGIYFVKKAVHEYGTEAGHVKVVVLKKLDESEVKLGNVEAKCEEFIGCVDESHWDEAPCRYDFAVYKRFTAKNFNKSITIKVRDLTEDELMRLIKDVSDDFTKLCIARFMPNHGPQAIIDHRLYEKFSWHVLEGFAEVESRIKELYIQTRLEWMKSEHQKGNLRDAASIAYELKKLGYEDDETKAIIERYEKEKEEERRKWEEERKRREEEEKRRREEEKKKVEEQLRKEFNGLPVVIENGNGKLMVKLAKFVDKATFNKYVETCKKLNLTFDAKTKTWFKRL